MILTSMGCSSLVPISADYDIEDLVKFNKPRLIRSYLLPLLEHASKDKAADVRYKEAVAPTRLAAQTNGMDNTLVIFNLNEFVGSMDDHIPCSCSSGGRNPR